MTQSKNTSNDLTLTYQIRCLLACLDGNDTNIDNNSEISMNSDVSDSEEGEIIQQVNPELQSQTDIRADQEELSKQFFQSKLTKNNKMQLDLFHLLKASNAPLILFDRITILSNGLTGL